MRKVHFQVFARWFEDFMDVYLRNAAQLRRNDLAMLPPGAWNRR